jgi:hypothetical protein
MRVASVLLLIASLAFATPSIGFAQEDIVLPGWTHRNDGTYQHSESGVVCPQSVQEFEIRSLVTAVEPNLLGICQYADRDGRQGEIRVRRYVLGSGEAPHTALDFAHSLVDTALLQHYTMGGIVTNSSPANQAPSGIEAANCNVVTISSRGRAQSVSVTCNGPGPAIDGEASQRQLVTVPHNHYFVVDCVAWEKKTIFTLKDTMTNFPARTCGNLLFKDMTGEDLPGR